MEMATVVVVVVVQVVDRGAATATYTPFSGVQQPKDIFFYSTTQNQ
jgi:hypothetical protein